MKRTRNIWIGVFSAWFILASLGVAVWLVSYWQEMREHRHIERGREELEKVCLLESRLLSEPELSQVWQELIDQGTSMERAKVKLLIEVEHRLQKICHSYTIVEQDYFDTPIAKLARKKRTEFIDQMKKSTRQWQDRLRVWQRAFPRPMLPTTLDNPEMKLIYRAVRAVLSARREFSMQQPVAGIKQARQAHKLFLQFCDKYTYSERVRLNYLRLPVVIESNPPGAKVYQGSRYIGQTPLLYTYPAKADNLRFILRKPGYQTSYQPLEQGRSLNWKKFHHLQITLDPQRISAPRGKTWK